MSFIGNLIWLIFGGFVSALGWAFAGLILCITIVGIPFGTQCIKIAGFILWPFGSRVEVGRFGALGFIGNIIWLIFFGWELCLWHLIIGLILCLTIVGIPFGKQHFKFAKLALLPFGASIIR